MLLEYIISYLKFLRTKEKNGFLGKFQSFHDKYNSFVAYRKYLFLLASVLLPGFSHNLIEPSLLKLLDT